MTDKSGLTFDTSAFTAGLDSIGGKALEGGKRGMHDAMDDLLRRSRELAPLDKGTLRTTAWTEVETEGSSVVGEVYYSAVEDGNSGRFNYALYTHEMGEFKNPTTPGTQPKYLERPYKENVEEYRNWIAEEIRKELG
ncbi:HK97 gp10 family phage protein [Paenibacillus sp. NPDC057967]|uniref:HK97 gp10 family phage protein n=1 Tax=Paenibacillus sp. NPDC057967 TaxID=3346293 RepID=UPI0036DC587F